MTKSNLVKIAVAAIVLAASVLTVAADGAPGDGRDKKPPRPKRATARPAGTLGTTYQRPSWPIPHDEHPRVGMLAIELPERIQQQVAKRGDGLELKLAVQDIRGQFKELEGFTRDDGTWHFDSEPLDPGIPHIYDVRLELVKVTKKVESYGGREVETRVEEKVDDMGVRRVRLIPGRIVELSL